MKRSIAVLDACVLYSAPLRDFFLHLSVDQLYFARWSSMIHDEWMRNLLRNRPDLKAEHLQRTRELMDAHAVDSLVIGYEDHIDALVLPDPDDRHVLAAAIHAGADTIVTWNERDFPVSAVEPFQIRVKNPDQFICELIDADSTSVCVAAKRNRENLKRSPKSPPEFLATLRAQGLVHASEKLRSFLDQL